jgi:hypothetical protein
MEGGTICETGETGENAVVGALFLILLSTRRSPPQLPTD